MNYKVSIRPDCMAMLNERSFFVFKHKGLLCCIGRNTLGTLNGYVAVPRGHPYFGKDYDEIEIEVHGGLTYAYSDLGFFENGIFEDIWWLGFDTAHFGDSIPFSFSYSIPFSFSYLEDIGSPISRESTYKNFDYVKAETISLADQLVDAYNI